VLVVLHRWAGAHQVPVAVHVVDAPHRREVLVGDRTTGRVDGLGPGVGVVPGTGEHRRGVRRVHQGVVVGGPLAGGDPVDLGPDGQHGVTEPVEFVQVL